MTESSPRSLASDERRIVAIVLPDLLCEIATPPSLAPKARERSEFQGDRAEARGGRARPPGVAFEPRPAGKAGKRRAPKATPLGVLLTEEGGSSSDGGPASSTLAAVNSAARHFGALPGQTVTEAHAFVAHLVVKSVTLEEVGERLGEIAEIAMAFGPTTAVEAPDTVWVDVTGAAHLSGGEERLALEIATRVRALGHQVRVTISSGPRLAQAFARWGKLTPEGIRIVSGAESGSVAELPVRALPIEPDEVAWLARLGVYVVGDLTRLPRAAVAPRLRANAGLVLDLACGKDGSPLVPYVPPRMPKEETRWEEPADGIEPLLFVLRGLVSRLSARLEGRGEAVQGVDLVIEHDRSIARTEDDARSGLVPRTATSPHLIYEAGSSPTSTLHFELATPLYKATELFRVLSARLGRCRLPAPSVGLRLEAKAITRALSLQLSLSRYAAGLSGERSRGPEMLPIILSELVEDLGKDKVGVLEAVSSHRPENKSRLVPVSPDLLGGGRNGRNSSHTARQEAAALPEKSQGVPTRLLRSPVPLEAPIRRGATVLLDHRLYTIDHIRFENRLESVEWWTHEPVSRDYLRVWLGGSGTGLEALVYVDRATGRRWIHGICD